MKSSVPAEDTPCLKPVPDNASPFFNKETAPKPKLPVSAATAAGDSIWNAFAIDQPLPDVLDDTSAILPAVIHADLVLDYLRHPDLSEDLALLCERQSIPMIAPGRTIRYAVTPPT